MTLDIGRDGFGYAESYDEKEKRYRGLIIGAAVNNPVADGRSVLVKPEVAVAQEAEHQTDADADGGGSTSAGGDSGGTEPGGTELVRTKPTHFYGRKTVNATRLGRDAGEIANELVAHLVALAGVDVEVTIEVDASGAEFNDNIVRIVTENARALRSTRRSSSNRRVHSHRPCPIIPMPVSSDLALTHPMSVATISNQPAEVSS